MKVKQYFQQAVFIILCFWTFYSYSQNSNNPKTITNTYYIQNANVITKPGTLLKNTNILVENGIIKQIGKNVEIPFSAEIIPADSLYVYAGFIDAASHTAIALPSDKKDDEKVNNPGNPPNHIAGITPYIDAFTLIDSSQKSIAAMRENGFILSHSFPQGGMLTGSGVIVSNLQNADNPVIKQHTAMMAQFKTAPRMYPSTVIGIIAKWKDLYKQAENTANYQTVYNKNPNGKTRPVVDDVTNAMIPVVQKKLPVFFKTEKILDIQRAIKLSDDLGFSLVLTEVKHIYPIKDIIKQKNIPVLLSIDLPKEKEDKKNTDEDNLEKIALKKRKQETLSLYLQQASLLRKRGHPLCLFFFRKIASHFKKNILQLIKNGLSENAALKALTTTPAKILGIEEIAGTIEPGKLANLVITQKPYFTKDAYIKYVFTEGFLHNYKDKTAKKSNNKKSNPSSLIGEWAFEIDIPDQAVTGTLLMKNIANLQVTFTTTDQPNRENNGENVTLTSNLLTFDAEVDNNGELLQVNFNLDFDGDNFNGNVTVGNYGTFLIEGKKNNPENN